VSPQLPIRAGITLPSAHVFLSVLLQLRWLVVLIGLKRLQALVQSLCYNVHEVCYDSFGELLGNVNPVSESHTLPLFILGPDVTFLSRTAL
jgi:hypothetical protein